MIAGLAGSLALVAVALLLGATWYEAVVMAPNYERDVPTSIAIARQFLVRTTPAHYFRVVAPVAQVLTVIAVLADWSHAGCRAFLAGFLALIVADVFTYAYHYPRLAIMFKSTEPVESTLLRRAAREWAVANWVRGVLLLGVFAAVLFGLLRVAIAHAG
jgi:hypothetical protein